MVLNLGLNHIINTVTVTDIVTNTSITMVTDMVMVRISLKKL
jgi:hypothetical protein